MTLRDLWRDTVRMFRPPADVTVSAWADRNRILVSQSSNERGPWRTSRAPYQREIMDAYTQRGVWKIVLHTSAQVGKTDMMLNMMGRAIDIAPGPMLAVQPKERLSEDFSKRRFTPMVQACKSLNEKVQGDLNKDKSNTIFMKSFPGGNIAFVSAHVPDDLSGRPIRDVFMDEIDRYPDSSGEEGDPIALAEMRTENFPGRKVVLASTPTIKGKSKIAQQYQLGTQEEWHIACPRCGAYHYIEFKNIKYTKIAYEQDGEKRYRPLKVVWQCPSCKAESEEYEVKRSPGQWVAMRPDALEDGIRSFRLNAFVSPWSSWKRIVKDFLDAEGHPDRLRAFLNTRLGETWELRDRSGAPEKLYARRERYEAEVPEGVLVLTMGVDTQGNRLEYEIVGWGRGDESWGISRGIIPGRPDAPEVWEEIDGLLRQEWRLKNGKAMRLSATFVDSGSNLYTQAVYDACGARRGKYRIWPIKGQGGVDKPYVRLSKSGPGSEVGLFLLGVDSGKEAILYETGIEKVGPRYMHFPLGEGRGYDEEYFRGLISERLVIHRKSGRNTIAWEKTYDRNEPLDCRNYARAAYKGFKWDLNRVEEVLYGIRREPSIQVRPAGKTPGYVVSKGIEI